MTQLRTALADHIEEFNDHIKLAHALDRRLVESEQVDFGETTLTVRHLLTIKSGLIVHLYNIVESVMTLTIEELGKAVINTSPRQWSSSTLKEWLRFNAAIGNNGNEDTRLEVIHKAALKLLDKDPIDELKFKKPSGTWSDKLIYSFSQRLEVNFRMTPKVARENQPLPKYGDKTPLEFLADRRNAIAHGRRSFERGAEDLTLQDIQKLADATLCYMELAVDAFQDFADRKSFLTVAV
ncbi:MAE_28990/MAE_18760 family HEPN-like nuclease [Halomonas sp. McH1-25]|uniref:MAE_28990/MAE_18760 family HEPN-like nuclease n=1 Tax=unclassified Halomonas TaxID=2609666 RepID=UPI001EF68CCB|nr:MULTISPECIES: MAE_28990/MAE_18760 family HEPN-like nuclease [unclassified Halomonas]MCG7601790.1 MAE_28990/MAE_18760 family HEPN-like nuclease [Halomonas sp. McH1-25]MCP1343966.1 MAE_28990/MAE_18760 family HEPN-like nuclease [Halomonas sp. FL8]MCP1361801.1 MAE_28990/MAE_18760 family HEPN-like nuclease [Halomonas sp. BBD45]MCP1364621.1 MAE_28990/MAE_18760 family HEPN-like nuclease [Halomonas sp. BBD48]